MGKNLDKFLLLMWKNWKLQIRRPIQTIIEVLVPVIFAMLLVLTRSLQSPEHKDAIVFKPYCPLLPQVLNMTLQHNLTLCNPASIYNIDLEVMAKMPNFSNYTLIYAPNTSTAINNVMDYFSIFFGEIVPLASNKEMENYYEIYSSNVTAAGILFEDKYKDTDDATDLKDLKVQFRFPSELRVDIDSLIQDWRTRLVYPLFQYSGPRSPGYNTGAGPNYYGEGFMTLQHYLTFALTLAKNHVNLTEIGQWAQEHNYPIISINRFAYAAWNNDVLLQALSSMFPLIVMMSFVYTCINNIKAITTEKEKQLKESMKIMGLPSWLHWTAWFVKLFIFLAIACLLMVVLLKVNWYKDSSYSVLTHADLSVLYVFMLLYACATITFCFAISVFFSKANTAATVAGLTWFWSYVPYIFIQQNYDTLSLTAKLFMSLLHNSGMAFGLQIVIMYEGTGDGIQWSNLFKPNSQDDNLSVGLIMIMLIVDSCIYLLIALYVEAVFPGEYGVPKPWYYFFTKTYWCGEEQDQDLEDSSSAYGYRQNPEFFQPEPNNLHAGIQIKKLQKKFGAKLAVNGLNLNMYEDQITVLLGHNGAGKTTTMSMLTGMITPTQGTATVNGYDIRTNIAGVRDSLGLCPQHNIIFDDMTVAEHIYFFGKLKGLKGKEIDAEIEKYVKLLDLEDKKNSKSSTLSGGMKRKLCVGMALCGHSKVVMLDEPTSGMDPSARRVLWNLIKEEKQGRTILLTTHFMDEADLLGDRIAIMAAGELQCCGSSFFLKKKYGTGYRLILDKEKDCNVSGVTMLLKRYIPDIKVDSNIGSELSYLLVENQSAVFEPMLRHLETDSAVLGIRSYGISLATLEEVFMKVGADHTQEDQTGVQKISTLNTSMSPTFTGGAGLIANQFYAMFMKKIVSLWRSWILLLIQLLIPSVFLMLAFWSSQNQGEVGNLPAQDMNLRKFSEHISLIEADQDAKAFADKYETVVGNSFKQVENITGEMLYLTETIPNTVRRQYLIGADFNSISEIPQRPSITAYFNNDPYHTPAISLSMVLNAVLKTYFEDSSIEFVNYPFVFTADTQLQKITNMQTSGFQLSFNMGFSMAFASAFFVMFIVREIVSKSKHLQFVSGMKVWIFWISHLITDLVTFSIAILLYIITLLCFQEDGFKTASDIGRMLVILVYFAWCVLPVVYLLGYLFSIPSTGFSRVTLIAVFTGCAGYMIIQIFQLVGGNLKNIGDHLHWVFLLSPWYSLITGISDSYNAYTYYTMCNKYYDTCAQQNINRDDCEKAMSPQLKVLCQDAVGDYFKWESPGIGRNLLFSILEGFFVLIILFAIEYKLFTRIIYRITQMLSPKYPVDNLDEDSDVAEERDRIRNSYEAQLQTNHILVLKDLTKYYKKFLAVNGLCLGIQNYECFGLLGVNGAGKTTTFKMMTGDETLSYGDGWVNGLSMKTQMKKVQKSIGYCPQFDALLDDMTARESVIMFALIRGIKYKDGKLISEFLAREFDFVQHLDKKVKELSGGNKRKLSTSLSLIGNPPILYLDEPTTGMDPATKRYLWKALCRIRDSGKCIVLTSHSMEECEALCTRLAIMVSGNFRCLGSTQHLKSKFADGFSLTVKIRKRPGSAGANTEEVEGFIRNNFPDAELKEKHEELLNYQIKKTNIPWSRMFGILESAKQTQPDIEDYSLGQSTLEQVFLTFTGGNVDM